MSAAVITPPGAREQLDYARRALAQAGTLGPSAEYARVLLAEALDLHDRIEKGAADPFEARAPGMGWWDDPRASALEFQADEAWQLAVAMEKRQQDEAARLAGDQVGT